MKIHVALLSLVTLLCLVAPAMAGPIQISTPSIAGYMTGSDGGFLGPEFFSSLNSSAPGNLDLSKSLGDLLLTTGAGSDHIVYQGGPPVPAPIPEPSGLMVMFGSGLFGVVALVRRKLKA